MSGMFGKNKRPLSDLLNPARRKGGTKGPPARRTKSFIHSLCICPCLSRAAFLVGWCGAGAPGSFSARSPCERGRGWCPPAGSDKGCASQLRSVALGSPEGRLCPDPGAPQPGAHSGEPERWKGATAPALCAASRGNAPVRLPRARVFLRSVCCSFSDVLSEGAVCVWCFSLPGEPPAGVTWGPWY